MTIHTPVPVKGDFSQLKLAHMTGGFQGLLTRLGVDSIEEADLSNAYIKGVIFPEGTQFTGDLSNTTFAECDVTGADFSQANTDRFTMSFCSAEDVTGLSADQIGTTFENLIEKGNFDFPRRPVRARVPCAAKLT